MTENDFKSKYLETWKSDSGRAVFTRQQLAILVERNFIGKLKAEELSKLEYDHPEDVPDRKIRRAYADYTVAEIHTLLKVADKLIDEALEGKETNG